MNQIKYGPLNKTIHTQTFELLTKTIITRPELVNIGFETQNGQKLIMAHVGQNAINVSNLLTRVNFHHIQMDHKDSHRYMASDMNPEFDFNINKTYTHLTPAERSAIATYTSGESDQMNKILYQNYQWVNPETLADNIVRIALVSSGLNKLMPSETPEETYRGESRMSAEDLQYRIELAETQGYTQEPAFKSTSYDEFIATMFAQNNCLIKFVDFDGKDISGLSYFDYEDEILFNVEKIQWLNHEVDESGLHIFTARAINPLDDNRDTVSTDDLDQFIALKALVEAYGISGDHLTDYNQSLIEQHIQPNQVEAPLTLSLDDVLDVKSFDLNEIISNNTQNPMPAYQVSVDNAPTMQETPVVEDFMLAPPVMHDELSASYELALAF